MVLWLTITIYAIIALSILYPLLRKSYFAPSFVLGNLAIFILLLVLIVIQPNAGRMDVLVDTILRDFAFRPVDLPALRLQTILSSMFLHLSVIHVMGNIIFLYLLGLPLEERVGGPVFASIYLSTGVFATLLYSLVRWDSQVPALGASGAIMGIAGAFLVLYPRDEIPMFLGPIFLPRVRVSLAVGVIALGQVILLVLGVQDGVAYAAHLGGIVAGIFLGPLLHRPMDFAKPLPKIELDDLATTDDLKEILERVHQESVAEVREAWVDHFLGKAHCPRCRGPLKKEGNVVLSDCGWSRRL